MPNLTVSISNPFAREEQIEVEIEFDVTEAEPDVGLSWGIDNLSICGVVSPNTGIENVVAFEKLLTEKDWNDIEEQISSRFDPMDEYDESDDRDSWR